MQLELSLFFSPLIRSDFSEYNSINSLFDTIEIHFEKLPDWQSAHLAIIGVPEERGTEKNMGTNKAPNAVRKTLYSLKKGKGIWAVVDLGNLRLGETKEETNLRLKEVCETLMIFNVIPIILGGSHDIMFGQYLSYEHLGEDVNILNIDSFADMESENEFLSEKHIQNIFFHQPNFLFNYTLFAYQTYLVGDDIIRILEKIGQKSIRLGQVRESLKEAEPYVREANLISFDISSIKRNDAPANAKAQAFGLTSDEACQICWYAGLSERMTSIGFYEFNPDLDLYNQTAEVLATMIWYVIEGFYHRSHEESFNSNAFSKYTVTLSQKNSSDIVFYKDNSIEKWWMEVPHPRLKDKILYLPCSHSDFIIATKGELPYRWVIANGKMF